MDLALQTEDNHTASVDTRLLNRELLVRPTDREIKSLIIVVGVRVVVVTDLFAVVVVVEALVEGVVDLGSGVVVAAASGR